jgi:serine/threonine protein kinase
MDQILPNGEIVVSRSNTTYTVKKKFNQGGQAELYLVESDNKTYVLKVYFVGQGTKRQREILERLFELGTPSRCFIWPIDLVDLKKYNTIGYIMDYVDLTMYSTLEDLLFEEESPKLFRDIIAAYLLSDAFFRLHIRGFIHADISWGNVWLNRDTGDVRISDCDNIILSNEQSQIGGTLPFKAPEVILQELHSGRAQLSADTDRHSLAVVLFLILFHHHPLEGLKENEYGVINTDTQIKMYGKLPIFIYDPKNAGNRPDPETQGVVEFFWEKYPQVIKDLFITTFTDGLKNPQTGRPRTVIWRKKLLKLRDSIIKCSNCSIENFIDADQSQKHNAQEYTCWNCEKMQKVPQKIIISGGGISHSVNLNEDMFLYKTHIDNSYNIEIKIGKIETKMKDTRKFIGIRNISSENWYYSVADKKPEELIPGKAIIASENIRIRFPGGVTGKFTS